MHYLYQFSYLFSLYFSFSIIPFQNLFSLSVFLSHPYPVSHLPCVNVNEEVLISFKEAFPCALRSLCILTLSYNQENSTLCFIFSLEI